IDPEPDIAKSYQERTRLFALPRSSWADYNAELISRGGGIFPRTAKSIALTPEIKALTGVEADKLSPIELIKTLLRCQTDLLWFGGIGTYIKASAQNNLDVGDRANDALRVDGRDVRAKVIGEGANLGATQLGRAEYARKGGRINTDAIDNSAGVDTSDHEVNLKILFSGPMRRGEMTAEARDSMLEAMTEDVAQHVLQDNYDQTLALSVAQSRAARDLDAHTRLMRDLERRGFITEATTVSGCSRCSRISHMVTTSNGPSSEARSLRMSKGR
ncbi:MAG: NAD-glutamate dehydrogenase, partial [Pseudolabrys sp.]